MRPQNFLDTLMRHLAMRWSNNFLISVMFINWLTMMSTSHGRHSHRTSPPQKSRYAVS